MIVVGFGGNVGGEDAVRARFVRAREALVVHGAVRAASLYRTAAIGPAQPDYLNTAVGVRWDDALPDEVIATLLEIERLLGRDRRSEERWGPRPIDLDVLWWTAKPSEYGESASPTPCEAVGSRSVRQPDLEIPHPRLRERRFALLPLLELVDDPTLVASEARVRDQRVELIASSW